MKSKWIFKQEGEDLAATAARLGTSPLVIRILANRGITKDEDIRDILTKKTDDFEDIKGLINADKAIEYIRNIDDKVRIIGDYDVDGICASTILYKGLKALSYDVSVDIPDRILDGYGLNINIINKAKEDGVKYIITCDNGIAAKESIEHANLLGMKVVVTDHHEVPVDDNGNEIIPDAVTVVDPKMKDSTYRTKEICGAYVAYKIIANLLDIKNHEEMAKLRRELLVLAAFASYCDVMPLKGENRYLIKYGMENFKKTDNLGLNALVDVRGYSKKDIDSYSLGFVLGPCINATGRIADALQGVKLLTTEDPEEAIRIARDLDEINKKRKTMTEEQTKIAIKMIEESSIKDDRIIVLVLPECHVSICGLVAGRVKREYNKPTIVLSPSSKGLSGSARSIEEYNLFINLSKYKDMFAAFGGHAMAAGLSISPDRVDEFRKRINEDCTLTEEELTLKQYVDAKMDPSKGTLDIYNELVKLEPFGTGNIKPLLEWDDMKIKSIYSFGSGKYTTLKIDMDGENYDVKIFKPNSEIADYLNERDGGDIYERLKNKEEVKIDILYSLSFSDYNGPHTEAHIEEYR